MSETPNHGSQCEICGHMNPTAIETHHKLPQRYGGPDTAENLVSLCGSCHNSLERIYDDSFYQRLFDKVGYSVEEPAPEVSGRSIDPKDSPDRELPSRPLHATREELDSVEIIDLVEQGVFDWQELEQYGCLEKVGWDEWVQYLQKTDRENYGEVRERTEAKIECADPETAKFKRYDGVGIIHCGYCNTAFAEWEESNAVRHLAVNHGIENPYRADPSPVIEDVEQEKLVRHFGGVNVDNE